MNVWKAVKAGKLEWLEKHVEEKGKGELGVNNKSGETPLMVAVKEQQDEIVHFLLEHGVDANKADKTGHTALLTAVIENRSEDIVAALLDHGADVNTKDADDCSALHWAVRSEQEELVKLLLSRNADVNAKTKEKGLTALHYAAIQGNLLITQKLLSSGADKDAVDVSGQTPLFYAINTDSAEVVRELVVIHDCNLSIQNNDGDSVLHLLAGGGEDVTNVLQLVLNKNPDVNVQNKDGNTALHLALMNEHDSIYQLLVKHGAKDGIKNKQGQDAKQSNAEQTVSSQPLGEVEAERTETQPKRRRPMRADTEVAEFLINAGLDDHVPRFSKHGFHQLDDLERVDAQLLKEMKITAAERTKIIAEVSKLAPELEARREAHKKEREEQKKKSSNGSAVVMVWVVAILILLLAVVLYSYQ